MLVTLWFTQDLEPAFSNVTVTNEAGQRVDLGMPGFLKTVRPSCNRPQAIAAGDLPRHLARRFGRHPSDRRHLHLRRRQRISGCREAWRRRWKVF